MLLTLRLLGCAALQDAGPLAHPIRPESYIKVCEWGPSRCHHASQLA